MTLEILAIFIVNARSLILPNLKKKNHISKDGENP